MRKQRHRLQVSTFPFLAVLLCAMGALILVLLAMDRRGRVAAREKAAAQAKAQQQSRHAQVVERDRAHQAKKAAIALAWEKKRRELSSKLDAEEKALDGRLVDVRARMAEVARKLKQEEEIAARLREKVAAERLRLQKQNEALAAAEKEKALGEKKLASADSERARMTTQLVGLERTVTDLKKARERDASTYSVIPYHGKHGASRKPVYVECAGDGLAFHPDGKKVPTAQATRWLPEVQARLTALGAQNRPYVLVLIRPSGTVVSHQFKDALRGADIEFGYELVDEDWKFDFKDDGGPASQEASGAPKPAGPKKAVPAGPGGASGGPGLGSSVAISPPRRLTPGPPGSGGLPSGPGNSGVVVRPLTPPAPPRQSPATGHGDSGLKPPMILPPESRPLPPIGREAGKPVPPKEEEGPLLPGAAAPEARGAPAVKMPPRRRAAPVLRPASLDSNEVVVYIECFADRVVVHPSRSTISLETLASAGSFNPLWHKVDAALSRRPAGAANPRKFIRFLVHEGGVPTFHRAVSALERLPAEKSQQAINSGDDVRAIIAGH